MQEKLKFLLSEPFLV